MLIKLTLLCGHLGPISTLSGHIVKRLAKCDQTFWGSQVYNPVFVDDLAKRIAQRAQITTDAFGAYPDTILRYFNGRSDYAVMQKIYQGTYPDLDVIDPLRRYSPPKCIGVSVEIRSGEPDTDKICTSHVERCNLSVRHFTKRFCRLGLGWSRKLANHRAAVALFVVAYNFCKRHSTLGTSPAVRSKLTDHVWTTAELVQRLSATI
jgi:hypothetical protein